MTDDQEISFEKLMNGSPIQMDSDRCFICHRSQEDVDHIIKTMVEVERARINRIKQNMSTLHSGDYDDSKAKEAVKVISPLMNKDILLRTLLDRDMDYILRNQKAIDEKIPGFLAITEFYCKVLEHRMHSARLYDVLKMLEHGDYRKDLLEAKKMRDSEIKEIEDNNRKLDDYLELVQPSNKFKQLEYNVSGLQKNNKKLYSTGNKSRHSHEFSHEDKSFYQATLRFNVCPFCTMLLFDGRDEY